MIRIIGRNFQEAEVQEYALDSMIAANKIIAFSRFNEWVVVGRDPVRKQNTLHAGEERRRTVQGPGFFMK